MKTIFGAIALILAAPVVAQVAPAEHKMECCEKMKAEGKECCCKDMAKKGHDMKQDHQPKADGADHQDHGEHAH
jgi:hypothetical protein